MLHLSQRLPSSEFHRVLSTGQRQATGVLGLVWTKNQLAHSRFGFIVGTQFDRRATARNRAKRLLREVVRRHLTEILPGHDIILSFKNKPPELDYSRVEAWVKELLLKTGLWQTS